jgi:hypothetical protein
MMIVILSTGFWISARSRRRSNMHKHLTSLRKPPIRCDERSNRIIINYYYFRYFFQRDLNMFAIEADKTLTQFIVIRRRQK